MQNLIEELNKIKYEKQNLQKQIENIDVEKKLSINKIFDLNKELVLNVETKEFYNKSVEYIYQNSLGKLQDSINAALSYIFYDKNYSIEFELGSSRSKTLKIYLIKDGKRKSLKNGSGAGIRSVVSIIFLIYYLLSKKSEPILFLDEAYYQISADYVERFFEFIDKIIKEKNFKIIMITHDVRFMNFADNRIQILDGKLTDV